MLNFKFLWEALYSRPPPLQALKAFGCACYPYLRPYKKNTLQPISQKCIFLGYTPLSKGYICLDPSTNKIYIACYALFNESLFPFVHSSSYTTPHTPFTSDFSHWFPQSSLVISEITNDPSIVDSSSPLSSLDITASLLPSMLTSSLPILVVPPPFEPVPTSSIVVVQPPFDIPSSVPTSTSVFVPTSYSPTTTLDSTLTHNTHIPWLQGQNMVYISLKLCKFIRTIL